MNAVDAATEAALERSLGSNRPRSRDSLRGPHRRRPRLLRGRGHEGRRPRRAGLLGPAPATTVSAASRLGRRPSVPVIAKVNGIALGGGFEMVLGCDLVVAADTASFGLPEPRVGRLPLDGMVTLPRRLPRALAMGLLLTGRRIDAAEALEHGLVNQVAPLDELDDAVDAWVRDILVCAPLSLRAIKRSANDTAHLTVPEARNARLPSLVAALQSRDADEGVAAFREKRAPVWSGS